MQPVDGVRRSLWRALAVFRVVTLAVALVLIVKWQPIYARPLVAVLVGVAMAVVTVAVVVLALSGRAHRPGLVAVDTVITAELTVLTRTAQTPTQFHGGMVTLTTIWAAGPTIEAAFVGGALSGIAVGLAQYLVSAGVAESMAGRTLYSGVLLVLTGGIVGLVTSYAVRAEDELRVVAAAQASLAERERLTRSIHDGVLQVLGLVHRTGRDAAEPWATLAIEAGEQEAALRALITSRPTAVTGPDRDLAEGLRALRSPHVTVSTPAEPVSLPATAAAELTAAVRAALANVQGHAGPSAHAWVLVDAREDGVAVTVRDDGVGFEPRRLVDAEDAGRLGVASSIRGRVRDLGGTCTVTSAPGDGTTIEMVIPR